MDKRNIIIGDKEYTVEIADTSEEQKKGLQNREYYHKTVECYLFMINHKIKQNFG